MKKDLLVCVPPSTFFEHPLKKGNNHKISSSAASIIIEEIDINRYNVDYIDYDALLIKRHNSITSLLNSTKVKKSNLILDLILDHLPTKRYDVIMVCGQFMTNHQIQLLVTIKYILELNRLYPDATIIAGGNDWRFSQFLKNEEIALDECQKYLDSEIGDFDAIAFKDLLSSLQWPSLKDVPENVHLVKYFRESFLSQDLWDKINRPADVNKFNKIEDGRIKYSRITPVCKIPPNNLHDLKYSYDEIFSPYETDIHTNQTGYVQCATVLYTEGCPGRCAYCEYSTTRFVSQTFDLMKDSIKSYVDHGFNSFFILDCSTNQYADKLCNWIIQNNIDISWSSSFNLKNTNDDFFKMLFQAGCRYIDVGIETADDDQLKYIHKNITVNEIERAIQSAHHSDLYVTGNFIFGLPYETNETISKTLNFVNRNQEFLDGFSCNVYKPDDDSLFVERPSDYNIIMDRAPDYIDYAWGLNKYEWQEIDNPRFENFKIKNETYKKMMTHINQYVGQLDVITDPQPQQHLLFALYKILKNKKDVQKWLKNNYI